MDRKTLEKIKPLLAYGDIKAISNEGYTLTKTGIEKLVNEYVKVSQVEKRVSPKTADWTKEKPTTPCVFMTRVWDDTLKIYDYNLWRLITTNGESLESPTYLGWYTEDGDEWDDYSDCNFDEYKIIEEI